MVLPMALSGIGLTLSGWPGWKYVIVPNNRVIQGYSRLFRVIRDYTHPTELAIRVYIYIYIKP